MASIRTTYKWVVSLAAVACLVAAGGCRREPPSKAAPPASTRPVPAADSGAAERLARVLRSQFDDENIDGAVEALARAGVRVYTDDGGRLVQQVAGTASPLKFFRQQARNMALAVATGEGTWAQDLNAVVPAIKLGQRNLPASAMLAAYVTEGKTFGADLSRRLMGAVTIPQHQNTSWHTLVLALFLAETVPPESARNALRVLPVVHAGDGPCGVANDFLNSAGSRAVEAIAGPPEGGSSDLLFSLIAAAADAVFGMAVSAARQAASEALGLATVQKATFAINLITTAQALFEQWTIQIASEPSPIGFVNHGSQVAGRFNATVSGGEGIAWPSAISECAMLLGLTLPGSPSAPGSKAKWMTLDGFGTYVTETRRDEQIKPDNTAVLEYRAAQTEPPSRHAGGGDVQRQPFRAILIVENASKEALKDFLAKVNGVIGSFLPSGVQSEVFGRLVAPWGSARGDIEFHPSRSATSSFTRGAVTMRAYTCSAPEGPWQYTVRHAFSGTATGTFVVPGGYSWTMKGFAAISASGTVALQGDSLVFSGGTAAQAPTGAGASADGFSVPIVYEDVPECRR